MAPMTTASLLPDLITQLWREARAWLAEMLSDFISPAAVLRTVARGARVAFRRRLQMLESLVMKLLLVEASRVATPDKATMPGGIRRSPRRHPGNTATQLAQACGYVEHPDHPITWRVRFHGRIPRQRPRAATLTPRPRTAPAPEHIRAAAHARRLARRFEALRRVIADPRPAIAALARKLRALGQAAYAVARRVALWRPRMDDVSLAHGQATVHAHEAAQRWAAFTEP